MIAGNEVEVEVEEEEEETTSKQNEEYVMLIIIIFIFLISWLIKMMGMHTIFGPALFGLFLPVSSPFHFSFFSSLH